MDEAHMKTWTIDDLSGQEKRLLSFMREAKERAPEKYLAVVALIYSLAAVDKPKPDGYSRGDFNRAIKVLRQVQAEDPGIAGKCDAAAAYIREHWLNRSVRYGEA